MTAIDFANSYMTWSGRDGGSISRIVLDAACTVTDPNTGLSESYYLIAPCRAEHTHSDGDLIVMPNYDFRAIFSADEHLILRKHWVSDPDYLDDSGLETTGGRRLEEYGLNDDRWAEVRLDVRRFAASRTLRNNAAIVDATLRNVPLVGRTEVRDDKTGRSAVLEYPIRTMNIIRAPARYQVDTGPLITPDFGSTAEHTIERFDVAHIVYNRFDGAELILRRPTSVLEGGRPPYSVTDYSVVDVRAVKTQILAAEAG